MEVNTQYFVCRNCGAEFEMMLLENVDLSCLVCGSDSVKLRKNAKINCSTCCDGCPDRAECVAWKDN